MVKLVSTPVPVCQLRAELLKGEEWGGEDAAGLGQHCGAGGGSLVGSSSARDGFPIVSGLGSAPADRALNLTPSPPFPRPQIWM